MAEKVRLTAAEIVFLLTTLDTEDRSKAPALLGFAESEKTDAVAVAGLGSLILRGLAIGEGERVQLAPTAAAVGEGLMAERCVQIGLLARGRSDGAILFDTGTVRLLVTPLPHRCFEITGLEATAALADPLVHIAGGFLRAERPAVVSIVFGVPTPDRPAADLDAVIVGVDAGGEWTFARGGVPGETRNLTQGEALAKLRGAVSENI